MFHSLLLTTKTIFRSWIIRALKPFVYDIVFKTPMVWGDPSRLNISPNSRMLNTLFNTSSGAISVGCFTFASHNVSILTGCHDYKMQLQDRISVFERSGRDIVIGKGVWLGSNCTILGPCQIRDHAVIAAGSVIVPGTIVEECEIFAGVPAKKVKKIEFETKPLNYSRGSCGAGHL